MPSADTAGQGNDKEFLLAPPDPTDALKHPNGSTITLGSMKQLIADITAEYDGGDGSDAYRECLDWKYEYLELVRNQPITTGVPYTQWKADPTIDSGQPTNTAIDSATFTLDDESGYQVGDTIPVSPLISFLGTDAGLFTISTTPVRSGLEYDELLHTTRPLPAGTYEFVMETSPPSYAICNFAYREEYTVSITAPDNTLHETFFDPVTDGTAVAADSSNGVLNPSAFTDANNRSATVQRIEWASDTVKMKVSPHTGLAGHKLDFIELDGTVSLSLDVDDATVDAANKTLSWTVTSQPWENGDKLMLRIASIPQGSP